MTAETVETDNSGKTHGKLAVVFAIFSFIACNGLFVLIAVFAAIGVTVSINPHLQAATISLFSVATLALVIREYKKNRNLGPLILATAAAITMIGSMYIYYNKIIESLGLLALFTSALWSWQASRTRVTQRHSGDG